MTSGVCALRPGFEDLDQTECGRPSAFVLKDRHGSEWGACKDANHVLATLVAMAPNAPVTVHPVAWHLPSLTEALTGRPGHMTEAQFHALKDLARRYHVDFDPDLFRPDFSLPDGWLSGTVGPIAVGVSPEGEISS